MNPHTAHPSFRPAAHTYGVPDMRPYPRRALTTGWVASTVALVLFPLSVAAGLVGVFAAMVGSGWTGALFGGALVGALLFVLLTITALVAAIIASRPSVRGGNQVAGIWVLVAIDLLGLAYLATWFIPFL